METSYLRNPAQSGAQKQADRLPHMVGLIIATVVILAFFTQGYIQDFMEKSDTLQSAQDKLVSLTIEKTNLQTIEKDIASDTTKQADLKRYAGDFREDEILDSLFSQNTGVSIQSVSLDRGQKMPNGLSMANVNLGLTVTSKAQLSAFLDYLTAENSPKRYVIKSVDYPFGSSDMGGSINLSLGTYYFSVK